MNPKWQGVIYTVGMLALVGAGVINIARGPGEHRSDLIYWVMTGCATAALGLYWWQRLRGRHGPRRGVEDEQG